MLNRLPRQMPPLAAMLEDIGNPKPPQLARALGVSTRTVQRWLSDEQAPRTAMLAIFWLTRWGRSQVNCEAVNEAAMFAGLVSSLQRRVEDLQRQVDHLRRIGDFGAANDPAPPASRSIPPLTVAELRLTPLTLGATEQTAPVLPELHPEPIEKTMLIDQRNRARCTRIRNSEEPKRKVRAKRWRTPEGFRFIRVLSDDHNADRWMTHMARMRRVWNRAPDAKRFYLRLRRVNRSKAAAA